MEVARSPTADTLTGLPKEITCPVCLNYHERILDWGYTLDPHYTTVEHIAANIENGCRGCKFASKMVSDLTDVSVEDKTFEDQIITLAIRGGTPLVIVSPARGYSTMTTVAVSNGAPTIPQTILLVEVC